MGRPSVGFTKGLVTGVVCMALLGLFFFMAPGSTGSKFVRWNPEQVTLTADGKAQQITLPQDGLFPHPHLDRLLAEAPHFPKASTWVSLQAVQCLRDKFAKGPAQDMRVYSQWGEDGIIQAIFMCIGVTDRSFAEFGSETGVECTTRWLRTAHGFKGLLMDGGNYNPAINLQTELIQAETISDLLHKHKVPYPVPDQMTIDIDQNTWHVAAAVMQGGWRPRSLTVEINRNFLPHQAYTVPYEANTRWDGTCVMGASVLAFVRLFKPYGYQLVAVDQYGVNAFFVHESTLGWWPKEIHATTPSKDHPLQQIWTLLNDPCHFREWIEVPELTPQQAKDLHWSQMATKKVVLDHWDIEEGNLRVMFPSSPGADNATSKASQDAEWLRYSTETHTYHYKQEARDFAARLRLVQYAGKPVANLPNVPGQSLPYRLV